MGDTQNQPQASSGADSLPARILVIDDDDMVRETVVLMLGERGHEVTEASGGAEGVEYYRTHRADIDLVVLDVLMPEMDGQTTFRQLRQINPEVKVLLATGYDDEGPVQEMLDAGAAGLLRKPYLLSGLVEAVSKALA